MLRTNINIISGFLGAGKTTFLKKIIPEMKGKIVLIENEFGNVGIDGDLMDNQLPIKEIYAGCICCSVVLDFKKAIEELTLEYRPDHILIEPSGVGSLSDIIKVCKKISEGSPFDIRINHLITIVDVSSFSDYSENFGGFYLDQIKNAHIIFLSHFEKINHEEVKKVISKIRLHNQTAFILEEEWYTYEGYKIIDMLNTIQNCEIDIKDKTQVMPANRMFCSVSLEAARIISAEEIDKMIASLKDKEYGFILRAKGILELETQQFINFNFTPHHYDWEYLKRPKETKVVVIGSNLNNENISKLFQQ